jgi:hypothetical protein
MTPSRAAELYIRFAVRRFGGAKKRHLNLRPFDGGEASARSLAGAHTGAVGMFDQIVLSQSSTSLRTLILGVAVAFLKLAFELVAPTIDSGQIIIGQLAPLLSDTAGKLLLRPHFSRSSDRSPVLWFWRMTSSSWLGAAL